jgi:PAS domain S-box-containing protein
MVVAPLRDGPRVIGVLKVMGSRPGSFTATDVSNLQILVESLGAVLQRQMATERVRQSEERFRLLTRATNDAVWDWDLATDALWWNDGYEILFGRRRDEVPADIRSWTDYIHPEDLARVTAGIHAVIDGGGTEWSDEYRYRHQDGRYIHVSDRGEVVRDATGRAVRMIGGMTDLTERKRIEDKLREQAALLDTATDAILVRDLEQRILYWNRSAERVYGWTAGEAIGRFVRDLLYETPEAFEGATAALLAKGEWIGVLAQRTKDGRALTVECRWTLVCDAQGRPKSILAINTDITERQQLEQQFLRAQRMESIGTLAGGIAHDLNNLLAPILMGAELLQRQQLTDSGRETLRNIERSARRSTELVRQVLSFARGIAGERIPLQVRHLVREIEDIIASTFPRNINLEVSLPKDLWLVPGDATQLNQVLLNLCVNARDAMPEGGRLAISATNRTLDAQYAATDGTVPAGDYVLVEVTDSGCGMTRELQERIFDPFFTTKELGKGTGLGLSTVLGIVRSHGGAVSVQSEPGRGSTFRVWLPAQPAAAVDESVAPPSAPAVRHGQGQLILLVDDEPGVLDITQQTLEAFGYRVLPARDGAQAVGLYALHQQEIAAVLTDLMMPVMDGPALIAALQRIHPGVRLVAATGVNTGDYMARAVALGVRHFLTKPFTAEALLDMVHEVLTTPPGGGSRPPMELPAQ